MKKSIPLVYVAGPYRSATKEGVDLNIASALRVGVEAARKGWSPVIPHSNTAHLDIVAPELGDQFWLDATMALMERCDAVVLCPGWQRSVGTAGEINRATELGLPVYFAADDLPMAGDFLPAGVVKGVSIQEEKQPGDTV